MNFIASPEYGRLQQVLDAEMKRLSQKGVGATVQKAEALREEDIEQLWKVKQLGDFNPLILVNTILLQNGINFRLHGGQEHRRLRYKPAQITLHEDEDKLSYWKYTDHSRTTQGGLKRKRIAPKEVIHHENRQCPEMPCSLA